MHDELYHYGKKGMKWGVRRSKQSTGTYVAVKKKSNEIQEKSKAEREKMAKVAKNTKAHSADRKSAAYASQSVGKRATSAVMSALVRKAIKDVLTGKASSYKSMSKAEMLKELSDVGKDAASTFVSNEATSRSVSKKYDASGKNVSGKENGNQLMTREQSAALALKSARTVYPFASKVAGMKYGEMKQKKAQNEARFNQWGGRILESKFDDVVGVSDREYRVL